MDKLTSTQVTWQDGVKYTQDQDSSTEGLLLDIPEQRGAEPLKDVVHIKQATKNLEHRKENHGISVKKEGMASSQKNAWMTNVHTCPLNPAHRWPNLLERVFKLQSTTVLPDHLLKTASCFLAQAGFKLNNPPA